MPNAAFPRGLSQDHRRVLVVTLRHIDELLAEAERAAAFAERSRTGSDRAMGLPPAERAVLADYLAQARERVTDAARALGLKLPRPQVALTTLIQTHLTTAGIDLAEVAPRRLTGFGALDRETTALVERVEADLQRSLDRIRSFLDRRGATASAPGG